MLLPLVAAKHAHDLSKNNINSCCSYVIRRCSTRRRKAPLHSALVLFPGPPRLCRVPRPGPSFPRIPSPLVAFNSLKLAPGPGLRPLGDPQYSSRSTSYSATVPDPPSAALASHGLPGQSSTRATATSRVLLPTSWRPSCPRPRGTPAQSSRLISLCRVWRRATASS